MTSDTKDNFKSFNVDVWEYEGQKGALIPLLQSAQDTYGFVPEKAIDYISLTSRAYRQPTSTV